MAAIPSPNCEGVVIGGGQKGNKIYCGGAKIIGELLKVNCSLTSLMIEGEEWKEFFEKMKNCV